MPGSGRGGRCRNRIRVNIHTSVGGGSGSRRGAVGSTHSHIRGGEAASVAAAEAAVAVASSAAGGAVAEKWEAESSPARAPRRGSAAGAGSDP